MKIFHEINKYFFFETALQIAVEKGNAEIVNILLENKKNDVNVMEDIKIIMNYKISFVFL